MSDKMVTKTANDRLKEKFDSLLWLSIIVSTIAHFSIFNFWPEMVAANIDTLPDEISVVELPPPEVDIPPPPEAIARPATPVISDDVDISEDITIAPTTFGENPVGSLPLPPQKSREEADLSERPVFTPYTVSPEILNRDEVIRVMTEEYPSTLRDAGIGGTVRVHFFITEDGKVERRLIDQSSGYDALDNAALRVAEVYRFSPALNRDRRVPVWISLSITFRAR